MKILLGKTAGYCFGVNNAVKSVENAINNNKNNKKIYTLGPIIHNNQVIEKLKSNGVEIIEDIEEIISGVVIIRSHGVGRKVFSKARNLNIDIIDATCLYVKSIQDKVKKYCEDNYQIVIIGDKNHPEVIGINGWCNDNAIIINNKNSVSKLEKYDKICVVAQTTITAEKFQEIVDQIKLVNPNAIIFNTICNATRERQQETKEIAQNVECMIIIGGFHSSNTQKLVEISKKYCNNTIHIETVNDLNLNIIKKFIRFGITAGASTPDWIIREVIDAMENETNNVEEIKQDLNMEETYENTFKKLKVGSTINGKIISINKDEIYLDIGYKSDGIIKKSDFTKDSNVDLEDIIKVGDEIEVMIVDLNDGSGYVKLSKVKIDEQKANEEIYKVFTEKKIIEGKIIKAVKGGLIVDVGFAEIFMPASHYHFKYVKNLESIVGEQVRGIIIEYDRKKNRTIFSQKVILEKELKEKKEKEKKDKEEFVSSLEVGNKITGKVKSITNYGIFIDIGPIDGFVHISDLSWNRIKHPSDLVKLEEEVEAIITEINQESFKIKLSVKNLTEEPWSIFIKNYNVEDEVNVNIIKVVPFGAFAEIMPHIEGLIHISELSHDKVANVEEVVKVGEKHKAQIIDINEEKQKISLSLKALTPEPQKKIEKNITVYEEDDSMTIGDVFGDLFKGE